jgi:hypothetical protein
MEANVRKILEECPGCGGPLQITGLLCGHCHMEVHGGFEPCGFCRLSAEQSTFLMLFVERRGNLSEMEKALGISYPTVRNKLEEIIRLLRQPEVPAVGARDEVLRKVAAGQLSASEALDQLHALGGEEDR